MAIEVMQTSDSIGGRIGRVAERPITFNAFLDLNRRSHAELLIVNGVVVERMAAQLDHEWLFAWLHSLMVFYARVRDLGYVLGSRTTVKIHEYEGRLPDILFVRKERAAIVQQKTICGPPEFVIEIVSPNDWPSDIIPLETDYRSLGVPEIWFIDRDRGRVRILVKDGVDYVETEVRSGPLRSTTMDGFEIQAEWVLTDDRPEPND